jgi:hypothetical protein
VIERVTRRVSLDWNVPATTVSASTSCRARLRRLNSTNSRINAQVAPTLVQKRAVYANACRNPGRSPVTERSSTSKHRVPQVAEPGPLSSRPPYADGRKSWLADIRGVPIVG